MAHSFRGENPPADVGAYLAIAAECHGDEVVVRLRGELDASNVHRLIQAMNGVLASPPHTLVVDTSGLAFADCAGLRALVSAHQRLAEQGRELVITDTQPLVQRLLRLTGLDEFFQRRQ